MDIKKEIAAEHSKAMATSVAAHIGRNPKRIANLFQLLNGSDRQLVQRSAYVLLHWGKNQQDLVAERLGQLVNMIEPAKKQHIALRRNLFSLLGDQPIPTELQGVLANKAFEVLDDPKEAVGLRACAITILFNIAKEEEDLLPELILLLEKYYQTSPASFKARAKRVYAYAKKLNK